jgi:LPXTG-site transpeptidase (sortase) family protein
MLWSTLALICVPISSPAISLPALGGTNAVNGKASITDFRLQIPSVGINLAVVNASFIGTTWDFSKIFYQAGYFEGTPLPGDGGNLVIGGHSELANRRPGPFYKLSQIKVGADIVIIRGAQRYTYTVTSIWTVDPDDISPIFDTGEILTLLTCSGFNSGVYRTRLVVRAERAS